MLRVAVLLGAVTVGGLTACSPAAVDEPSLLDRQGDLSDLGPVVLSSEGGAPSTLEITPASFASVAGLTEPVDAAKLIVAVTCVDSDAVTVSLNGEELGEVSCGDDFGTGYIAVTTAGPVDLGQPVTVVADGARGTLVAVSVVIQLP